MLQNTRILFGLVAALTSFTAFATHGAPPIALQQKSQGLTVAPGGVVQDGAVIQLAADSSTSSCNSATPSYKLEIEVVATGQPYSGTPTHTSGLIAKPNCVVVPYPATSVTVPAGTYKWRAREHSTSSTGAVSLSGWVEFNAGSAAFTVVPPNTPELIVQTVSITPPAFDGQTNAISLTVTAGFKNLGSGTGVASSFAWTAYLSTDKILDGADASIFVSPSTLTLNAGASLTDSSGPISLTPRPAPGTYYVLVAVDSGSAVTEFDETNNTGSTPGTFLNGIDYVATSITGQPAKADPATQLTLTPSFKNQGIEGSGANGAPGDVEYALFASFDKVLDAGDQQMARVTVNGFGAGSVHDTPLPFTVPQSLAGKDLYWILQVDPAQPNLPNPTIEASEANNVIVSGTATHITQADLVANDADLVDAYLGLSRRVADFGEPARFKIEAENTGDFAAIASSVGVIMSTDNTLSLLKDERVADVQVTSLGVAPNNKTTYDVTVTLPTASKTGQKFATGDYYFFLQLDSFNVIDESSESNNTRVVVGPVRVRTAAADYATVKVQAAPQAAGGETIALTRIFENVGTDNGPATEYRCYASVNPIITETDPALMFLESDGTTTTSHPLQLLRGGVDKATELVQLPGTLASGPYFLGCIVDPANTVTELSESNNAGATTAPIDVAAQSFRIVTAQLPDATLGMPYDFRLATVGGSGQAAWTALSSPPEGLSLGTSGKLSGTPLEPGITTFSLQAKDGVYTHNAVLILRVLPPGTQLTVTTGNLSPVVNSTSIPYQASLSASGGTAPYSWSLLTGALPNGISLDWATGVLAGTPKPGIPAGETKIKVQVRDALGGTATKELKLRVIAAGALAISTLVLPDALVNQEYLTDLSAVIAGGGTLSKPLDWSVVAGRLPEGLVLQTHTDGVTGLITGKATTAGPYPMTLQVQDADGRADTIDVLVNIYSGALRVLYATQPQAIIHPGDEATFQLNATGGVGATTYRLYSGALPPGMTVDAAGVVSGTVEEVEGAVGVHSFVVEAKDAVGARGLGAFSVEIVARPKPQSCSAAGTAPLSVLGLLAVAFMFRRRLAPSRA